MEDDVRQRINYVLHVKGYTQNSLSKGDLSIQARLSRQINRGSAITYQTISLILSSFEDISPEWLLTGKGEMLRAEQHIGDIKNSTIVGGTVSGSGNMISNNASESESYKKEVEHLKIIINEKDKQLAEKERIINLLMKQTINSH
ncbi:MAG: hypothetical protein RRY55_07770 [Bacteroidales bacterium]